MEGNRDVKMDNNCHEGIRAKLRNIVPIILPALFVMILFKCVLGIVIVPSESMMPTIGTGAICITWQLPFRINADAEEIERGDIVVFKPSGESIYYIKRVVGLPGDTLEFSEGQVYLNGNLLTEDYLPEGTETYSAISKFVVPDDSLFLMGDNRSNSRDSRFTETHFVEKGDVKAKLMFTIYKGEIS